MADGELLIPTVVLLIAADIRLAGSLSLAISLPTMLVALVRCSRDGSFHVLRENRSFLIVMAVGSLVGSLISASLLGVDTNALLFPALAVFLVASTGKIWRYR